MICPDTNVLVRYFLKDDPDQYERAAFELQRASRIIVTVPCLCELFWVLSRGYRIPRAKVEHVLRTLMAIGNIVVDHTAVEAGLDVVSRGGDFADGVIAHLGFRMGATAFVSFDRDAVRHVRNQGHDARHPSE